MSGVVSPLILMSEWRGVWARGHLCLFLLVVAADWVGTQLTSAVCFATRFLFAYTCSWTCLRKWRSSLRRLDCVTQASVAMKLFESCPGGEGCPCASVTHHGDAWGVEVQLHEFLTSALGGEEWSASRAGRIAVCTYWIRSCWFEPRFLRAPSPAAKCLVSERHLHLVGQCLPATCVVITWCWIKYRNYFLTLLL